MVQGKQQPKLERNLWIRFGDGRTTDDGQIAIHELSWHSQAELKNYMSEYWVTTPSFTYPVAVRGKKPASVPRFAHESHKHVLFLKQNIL